MNTYLNFLDLFVNKNISFFSAIFVFIAEVLRMLMIMFDRIIVKWNFHNFACITFAKDALKPRKI